MRISLELQETVSAGLEAWQETLDRVGRGTVLTSRRRRLSGMPEGRALHGRGIANMLADRGHDPFAFDNAVEQEASEIVAEEVADALDDAYRTNRPQTSRVRAVLRAAADVLAEWARDNLAAGRLGENASGYRKQKLAYARSGAKGFTGSYGYPPPYGIATGQFVEGIRAGWDNPGGRRD